MCLSQPAAGGDGRTLGAPNPDHPSPAQRKHPPAFAGLHALKFISVAAAAAQDVERIKAACCFWPGTLAVREARISSTPLFGWPVRARGISAPAVAAALFFLHPLCVIHPDTPPWSICINTIDPIVSSSNRRISALFVTPVHPSYAQNASCTSSSRPR